MSNILILSNQYLVKNVVKLFCIYLFIYFKTKIKIRDAVPREIILLTSGKLTIFGKIVFAVMVN